MNDSNVVVNGISGTRIVIEHDEDTEFFYYGPDICTYCDLEVDDNHCWACNEYKGIVDFDTYVKDYS